MPRERRRARLGWLLVATPIALAACHGKSKRDHDVPGGTGATGNVADAGGSSGTAGEAGATGAAPMDAGGAPSVGCFAGGAHFDEGARWAVDCNTCHCIDAEVLCTVDVCGSGGSAGMTAGAGSAGTGGGGHGGTTAGEGGNAGSAAGSGGNAGLAAGNGGGGSAAGTAGSAGAAPECGPAEAGSFCIVGMPTEDARVSLDVGMPLTLSIVTSGCHGTNCTDEVVRAECTNTLGSPLDFAVSPDICLASLGDRCSSNCTGTATVSCEVGDTLAAGDYTVGIGGSTLEVHFSVPSVVFPDELCAPPLRPQP